MGRLMPGIPRRILIVDDDGDTLTNLSDILTDIGYETETASDGPSALQKIGKRAPHDRCRFDLCLLDFKMPGMDGAELLHELHASCPKLPAIMITAFAGEEGVQRAMDAGTWTVLSKPVNVPDLLSLIDDALAGQPQSRETRTHRAGDGDRRFFPGDDVAPVTGFSRWGNLPCESVAGWRLVRASDGAAISPEPGRHIRCGGSR